MHYNALKQGTYKHMHIEDVYIYIYVYVYIYIYIHDILTHTDVGLQRYRHISTNIGIDIEMNINIDLTINVDIRYIGISSIEAPLGPPMPRPWKGAGPTERTWHAERCARWHGRRREETHS